LHHCLSLLESCFNNGFYDRLGISHHNSIAYTKGIKLLKALEKGQGFSLYASIEAHSPGISKDSVPICFFNNSTGSGAARISFHCPVEEEKDMRLLCAKGQEIRSVKSNLPSIERRERFDNIDEVEIKRIAPNSVVISQACPVQMITKTLLQLAFNVNPNNLVVSFLISEDPLIPFQLGMPANQFRENAPGGFDMNIMRRVSWVQTQPVRKQGGNASWEDEVQTPRA